MCGEVSLTNVISLTPTPPGNDFLNKEELGRDEPVYPLDLYFCEGCHHVQLGHVVDPQILYQKNYTYVSATSALFVNHLKSYATEMVDRFGLQSGDLVADIGSNDGNLLSNFKDNHKYRKTGKAGIFAGSLELVKEGTLKIKQNNLFENVYIKENNE